MKGFIASVVAVCMVLFAMAISADERCPLVGNTYVFTMEDTQFELSSFECTFGPGCESNCDMWYGDFENGPLYYVELPFSCIPGDATEDCTATIAGLPCSIDNRGDLKCLLIDTNAYDCYNLGAKKWCIPKDDVCLELDFELQE